MRLLLSLSILYFHVNANLFAGTIIIILNIFLDIFLPFRRIPDFAIFIF